MKDVLSNKHRTALLTLELPQAKKQIKDDDIMQAEQKHIARDLPTAATMGPDQGPSFYSTPYRAMSKVCELGHGDARRERLRTSTVERVMEPVKVFLADPAGAGTCASLQVKGLDDAIKQMIRWHNARMNTS